MLGYDRSEERLEDQLNTGDIIFICKRDFHNDFINVSTREILKSDEPIHCGIWSDHGGFISLVDQGIKHCKLITGLKSLEEKVPGSTLIIKAVPFKEISKMLRQNINKKTN